nr:hypothetical protein [Tanacetum cinerariifolium]
LMEEIDLTFTLDDPMPPGIEEDDDDSRDTLIREELLDNYSLPPPENESFHFDIPSFYHPPTNHRMYGEDYVNLSDLKQALRERHPMLIRNLVFSNE